VNSSPGSRRVCVIPRSRSTSAVPGSTTSSASGFCASSAGSFSLPALREHPRVDQYAGRAGVDDDAGVTQVHEFGGAHGRALPRRTLPRTRYREGVARVIVDVLPKAEILDPQGQAVARAMGRLGVTGVADVRQGKHFVLEVDDAVSDAELERIAGTLLANPVMEEWVVHRTTDVGLAGTDGARA
jgi:phosphoribosylformylglycinamidine synthase PurS subunit